MGVLGINYKLSAVQNGYEWLTGFLEPFTLEKKTSTRALDNFDDVKKPTYYIYYRYIRRILAYYIFFKDDFHIW